MQTLMGLELDLDWIREHVLVVTTALSILIEQFIWSPIVLGLFDIPVLTALNGGSFSLIWKELPMKLGGLLVRKAKVWTLTNVFIYNYPVEWRTPASNAVDILWQRFVSDVAADCGSTGDDVCKVSVYNSTPD